MRREPTRAVIREGGLHAAALVLLTAEGVELAIVQTPPAVAEAIVVAEPPVAREDTPLKLSFRVEDVGRVRPSVARSGGGLAAPEAAWSWRGYLHLDGWDPEGNVLQLRQVSRGASVPTTRPDRSSSRRAAWPLRLIPWLTR